MHNIYTTEGIILSSFDIGETDKFFWIFTRGFGLIGATAQSVRKIESKNRYGLQDFSVAFVSLVRGKEVWRITNVEPKQNLFFHFKNERYKIILLSEIFSFLKSFVNGEEKNEELFEIISDAILFLKQSDFEKRHTENFSLLVKIRILHNLGHFDKTDFIDFFDKNFSFDLLDKIESKKEEIIIKIEDILNETLF